MELFPCKPLFVLLHFFLLDLMVNDVALCKLSGNLVEGNTHFDHENGDMIEQVGNFINRFSLVAALCSDDDLGAFLADLLENLVDSFFKKVGRV